MARYLFQGSYSREGAQGLLREGGTKRRAAVERLLQSLGGRLEGFHYAFGDTDLYMIVDLPDHVAAASAALIVAASGAGHWKTTVLLTAEDMDRAAASGGAYQAPGG
ncbi:MAG TPA: GYD domain-containing protein [Candidatus Limnocylindria bacterium]|nr:GYD domain-containing protein [Candidatus Limnocylindria bacterium]